MRDYRAVDLDLRQRSCSRSRARHPIGPLLAVHSVTEQPQRVSPMALHLVGDDHPVDRITGQPAHVDDGGVVLEPYQAVWLSAGRPLAKPSRAVEGRRVELGVAVQTGLGEPGHALEARPAKPSHALEGRLVEPRVREGGLIVLARRCGQEAREQLGADHHPARIDAALGADPLEFGVESVGSLLGSVGEA